MPNRLRLPVLFAFLLVACAPPENRRDPGDSDGGNQVDPPAPTCAMMNAEGTGGEACADILALNETFLLDTRGDDTQIRPAVERVGGAIWAAYSRANARGTFDTWATRVSCSGETLTPPFRVNTRDDANEGSPVIAACDGNVYIAWHADSGEFPHNLSIRYRTFKADGTPLMDEDRTLQLTDQGELAEGNAWMPSIAALPGHRFAIAGARGIQAAPAFQASVQLVDAHGDPIGATVDANLSAAASQVDPSVAALEDGTVFLAWVETPFDGVERILRTRLAPDAAETAPKPPVEALAGRVTSSVRQATSYDGERVYMVFQTGEEAVTRVRLKEGRATAASPAITLGSGGRHEYGAVVAAGPSGGAALWLRESGTAGTLMAQRFEDGPGEWTLGEPTGIPLDGPTLGAYLPSITHVVDDVWFVAWTEKVGQAPAGQPVPLRVKGRFIELAE